MFGFSGRGVGDGLASSRPTWRRKSRPAALASELLTSIPRACLSKARTPAAPPRTTGANTPAPLGAIAMAVAASLRSGPAAVAWWRRHMTKGQRAMAVAMIYPKVEKGARVKLGDGYYGWPEQGSFAAIVVTASAGHVPPPPPGGATAPTRADRDATSFSFSSFRPSRPSQRPGCRPRRSPSGSCE